MPLVLPLSDLDLFIRVARKISKKTDPEIFNGILFHNGTLTCRSFTCSIHLTVAGAGAHTPFVLNRTDLAEFIKMADMGTSVSLHEAGCVELTVAGVPASKTLVPLDADRFPEVFPSKPRFSGEYVSAPQYIDLAGLTDIRQALTCASDSETRAILNSILFRPVSRGQVRIGGTDGHRLFYSAPYYFTGLEHELVLPALPVFEMAWPWIDTWMLDYTIVEKEIQGSGKPDTKIEPEFIRIRTGAWTIVTKSVTDSRYPDFNHVLRKDPPLASARFKDADTVKRLRKTLTQLQRGNNGAHVIEICINGEVTLSRDGIIIPVPGTEISKAENIPAIRAAFNADLLTAVIPENATGIELRGVGAPGTILTNTRGLFLLMPVQAAVPQSPDASAETPTEAKA
ncbi:MAG: hypothetical protein LBK99_16530 [Opitutaceae bacterium]|jgi:hypothetical protein|nr:hypothetical protein [Opitutaceae bacterium]